jgi:4-hydroxy-2-oxoheptanedioate aldolase
MFRRRQTRALPPFWCCLFVRIAYELVCIGPADLTLGLTGTRYPPGVDCEEPELIETIQRLLGRAHCSGIRANLHTATPAYALRAVEWGFDLLTVSSDVHLLAAAAHASVQTFRNGRRQQSSWP